ncbi:bifunctional nuclease family protein [Dermacoccus abyssi]
MKRAEVSGIRVELPTTSPVLLLRIEGGVTHVPIWIGSPEASMIALFAEGVDSPRPLTHDLVLDVAGAAGRSLERVEITALRDDVYEASLVFDDGGRVDSRASDAVALAMRASVDILVADAIVDEVGVQVADEQEEEVEKFREFLDHVSAEDFEEPKE